ncbi:MAG: hypothetical protein AAF697_02680 [Pseudomonadota bacterium]
MSFSVALILIAQSTSPVASLPSNQSPSAPVAERVTATVRVLAPERISLVLEAGPEERANAPAQRIQRSRDSAGTIWVEFS